jgi:hypothetical protein
LIQAYAAFFAFKGASDTPEHILYGFNLSLPDQGIFSVL